ncbi:MAG: VOC family protein [Chitinophagaceae bacterium]|jgi:PhnB protein|nr:MAG: VOC family protein [Chitinophagaceae bacterium]
MKAVNPYLNFDGQAEEAFNFYKSVFGGEFMGTGIMHMKDTPGAGEMNLSEEEKNRVMHVSLPLGNGQVLMASDIVPSMGHKLTVGNNNYICLSTSSREESDRIFNALSKDGVVEMPMQDQFWGDYYGSFKDKFGVCWMISYSKNR